LSLTAVENVTDKVRHIRRSGHSVMHSFAGRDARCHADAGGAGTGCLYQHQLLLQAAGGLLRLASVQRATLDSLTK